MTDLQKIKTLLTILTIIVGLAATYFARDLFLPIMIGLIVALTLSPVVRAMARWGLPEAVSAALLISGAAAVLATGGYLVSGPLSDMLAEAPRVGDELRQKLAGLIVSLEDVKSASDQVEDIASGAEDAPKVAIAQPGLLAFAAGSIANFVGLATVGLVLALLLLASGDLFYVKLVEALPTFSDKRRAIQAARDIERQISHYFLAILVINAILGCCIAVAMWALDMPNPVLWGALGFALNFLPFIGAMIGTVLVAAIGILTFDTTGHGLLPALIYLTLTMTEGNFVTPAVLGRRLELNVVSVFLTVIVWSWMWSIPGALMAVPFLVLLKVICDNVPGWRVFGGFLGARSLPQQAESAADQ